ncbi:MAG: hypothetical protein PUD92_07740 [Clostridiales bacterium]|nr:hypothetical protein [Clostridiales bacterium]
MKKYMTPGIKIYKFSKRISTTASGMVKGLETVQYKSVVQKNQMKAIELFEYIR